MRTDWSRLPDSRSEYGHVPALLRRVEGDDGDSAAWGEPGHRPALEHDLVAPAGFAALPRPVRLAPHSAEARRLAGETVMRAAAHHGCDAMVEDLAPVVAAFGDVLDRHLSGRPADWLACLRHILAVRGEYHWAHALEGFDDDILRVDCPHCRTELTCAVGRFCRYAQAWDGDREYRGALRPAAPGDLTGTGAWLHRIALRDGRPDFAEGVTYVFGTAVCPRCHARFPLGAEFTHANRPVSPPRPARTPAPAPGRTPTE